MTTNCYAMARGRVARFTLLDPCGDPVTPLSTVTTAGIVTATVDEITENLSTETFKNETENRRLIFRSRQETVRYSVDITLAGTNPLLIQMLTGQPLVRNAQDDVVGNDAMLDATIPSFAMEVWSRLSPAINDYSYGLTIFPRLKGGRVNSFEFSNAGSVSFSITGSKTLRHSRWNDVPRPTIGWDRTGWDTTGWDLTSDDLEPPIGHNLHWRNRLVRFAPEPDLCDDGGAGFGLGGFGVTRFGV